MAKSSSKLTTLELARTLNLVETIDIYSKNNNVKCENQLFEYLFVLDFESTCWDSEDKINTGSPEIIEFSVVLYNIQSKKIESEFQQYVMPTERPILSDFCKNFTNIKQETVDNGVPLGTCLMLFKKWIKQLQTQHNISFKNDSVNKSLQRKQATFVTWSNWDLKVCLQNECKRKRIHKPEFFNSWIDLRALYKEHYWRTPQGLKGALLDLGIVFKGREHCGLDDARNTAYLASAMITDGVVLQITKTIN